MPRRPTTTRQPKHEVLSLRLTTDRLQLLTRHRDALVATRGHPMSLGAAVFAVLEGQAPDLERAVTRFEHDQAPTAALLTVRRAWHADRRLSAAQWTLLADYVHLGTDTDQDPPDAARPAPNTGRVLLDAFEAVYHQRRPTITDHVWRYHESLGTPLTPPADGDSPDDERVLALVARHRHDSPLASAELARRASRCLTTAVSHENVPPALLDRALFPYWSVLWRLAARGHWLRHHGPVRPTGHPTLPLPWPALPAPSRRGTVTLSFTPTDRFDFATPTASYFPSIEGPDFVTTLTFGDAPQRVGLYLLDYLKLLEFRALLAAPDEHDFQGRYFGTRPSTRHPAARTLLIPNPHQGTHLDLAPGEWDALRQLLEDAWRDPFLQARLAVLADEYGAPV